MKRSCSGVNFQGLPSSPFRYSAHQPAICQPSVRSGRSQEPSGFRCHVGPMWMGAKASISSMVRAEIGLTSHRGLRRRRPQLLAGGVSTQTGTWRASSDCSRSTQVAGFRWRVCRPCSVALRGPSRCVPLNRSTHSSRRGGAGAHSTRSQRRAGTPLRRPQAFAACPWTTCRGSGHWRSSPCGEPCSSPGRPGVEQGRRQPASRGWLLDKRPDPSEHAHRCAGRRLRPCISSHRTSPAYERRQEALCGTTHTSGTRPRAR